MTSSVPKTLTGLARQFVQDQIIDEEIAAKAQAHAQENNVSIVTHLVLNGQADAKALAFSAAQEFGMPVLDLAAFMTESLPEKVIEEKLIRKHHTMPLYPKRQQAIYCGFRPYQHSGSR